MAHLHYLRVMERLIELETTPPFARAQPISLPDPYPRWWQLRERFDATFIRGMHSIAEQDYAYLAALNVSELAVALRRYHIDNGSYPESLTQLAPRYVVHVPIDPYTGRAPDYTRAGAGFALTSHGPKDMSWVKRQLLEWKIER